MLMLLRQIEKMFSDETKIEPYGVQGGYSGVIITKNTYDEMYDWPSVLCIYLDNNTIDGDIVFDEEKEIVYNKIIPYFETNNIPVIDVHDHTSCEASFHLHINIPYSIDKLKFLSQYF